MFLFQEGKGFQWPLSFSARQLITIWLYLLIMIPASRRMWHRESRARGDLTSAGHDYRCIFSELLQTVLISPLFIYNQSRSLVYTIFTIFCLKLPLAFRENLHLLDTYRWLILTYFDTSVKCGGKQLRMTIPPRWDK